MKKTVVLMTLAILILLLLAGLSEMANTGADIANAYAQIETAKTAQSAVVSPGAIPPGLICFLWLAAAVVIALGLFAAWAYWRSRSEQESRSEAPVRNKEQPTGSNHLDSLVQIMILDMLDRRGERLPSVPRDDDED
jgi:hypothetical protein